MAITIVSKNEQSTLIELLKRICIDITILPGKYSLFIHYMQVILFIDCNFILYFIFNIFAWNNECFIFHLHTYILIYVNYFTHLIYIINYYYHIHNLNIFFWVIFLINFVDIFPKESQEIIITNKIEDAKKTTTDDIANSHSQTLFGLLATDLVANSNRSKKHPDSILAKPSLKDGAARCAKKDTRQKVECAKKIQPKKNAPHARGINLGLSPHDIGSEDAFGSGMQSKASDTYWTSKKNPSTFHFSESFCNESIFTIKDTTFREGTLPKKDTVYKGISNPIFNIAGCLYRRPDSIYFSHPH